MKSQINVVKDIIDQMFIIAGYPEVGYDNIINRKDEWYLQWTMTEDQRQEWIKWGVDYFRKKRRWTKFLAEREMRFLDLYCGLKSEDNK